MNYHSRPYTDRQRALIAQAWHDSGCLVLGAVLARIRPRFTVSDYSLAVEIAREMNEDETDYSLTLEGEHDHAELKN